MTTRSSGPAVRFVLLLLVAAAIVVLAVRGISPAEQIDRARLQDQLLSLRLDNGLISNPPQIGPPSLDATAWTMDLAVRGNVDVQVPVDAEMVEQLRQETSDESAWGLYFAERSLVGSGQSVDDRYAQAALASFGAGGPVPATAAFATSADISAIVLETWAAASTLEMQSMGDQIPAATIEWAESELVRCAANQFVNVHLYEILIIASPASKHQHQRQLENCAIELPANAASPRNEEELLGLVGIALEAEARGRDGLDGASLERLRAALAPQPFMSTDSWWASYSLRGYVAAGGNAEDFSDVTASLLRSADDQGIIPATTFPTSSLQEVYFAVKIMTATGIDPTVIISVDSFVALEHSEESAVWTEADYAMWGDGVYLLGAKASESSMVHSRAAAESCAEEPPLPTNARVVGLCRSVAGHLGAVLPDLVVDWATWEAEPAYSIVSAAEALRDLPPTAVIAPAAASIIADPDSAPTSVIAQLVLLDQTSEVLLTEQEREQIVEVLEQRRGQPLDQMFERSRGDSQPDFYSTYYALMAVKV